MSRAARKRATRHLFRGVMAIVALGAAMAFAACGGDSEATPPASTSTQAATTAAPTPTESAPAESAPAESAPAEPAPAASVPEHCAGLADLTANYDFNEGISDYVAYTCGTAGPADESLPPVRIGWVNNQDGSIPPPAPQATDAAQFAVDYINEKLGGIGGHPLEIVPCFVKNAEEEGLDCAQQFLNDPDIHLITYGALPVGADTINSTVAGQKPIIVGFSFAPSNLTNPNTYALFTAGTFSVYGWGTFGRDFLHAKTNAVIYPEVPGFTEIAAAVKEASDAAGITTKLVGFDPNTTDLTGALTAAGAQSADMISPILASPEHCLAIDRAMDQLGIDPAKVVGFLDCTVPQLREPMGGDFPQWYYGQAQSGDSLTDNPGGDAFRQALADMGLDEGLKNDNWYTGMFGQILTIAQFLNKIGYDNLSPETIAEQAAAFRGPLLLGGAVIECGKYPATPAVCADGDTFFKYEGDGKFTRIPGWIQAPEELQAQLGAS